MKAGVSGLQPAGRSVSPDAGRQTGPGTGLYEHAFLKKDAETVEEFFQKKPAEQAGERDWMAEYHAEEHFI